MKSIVVPILILLIATQAFSKWVMLLEFRLNQDYIAANLCENRIKPLSACGGKCQLKKAMEKEETIPSSPAQNTKASFLEVLYPFEIVISGTDAILLTTSVHMSHYLLKHYSAPTPAIFHPPA